MSTSRSWLDALGREAGSSVTTAEQWWAKRRPEIVEDFDREVYGRVPNWPTFLAFADRYIKLLGAPATSGTGGK